MISSSCISFPEWVTFVPFRFCNTKTDIKQCGQSEVAPYYIAAAGQVVKSTAGEFGFSVPGYEDPEHDVLLAMMRWVENGTAPTQVIATKWLNDTVENGITMQRPLCPYPQKAVYGGSGDWKSASTWTCREGGVMSFPNVNGSVGSVAMIVTNSTNSTDPKKKNAATAVVTMGQDMARLAVWGFLAVLGIGIIF